MRNIETYPSKQMYPYLSLDDIKVAEFYHNIDRRRWLVWLKLLIFINFSGQLMVSLLSILTIFDHGQEQNSQNGLQASLSELPKRWLHTDKEAKVEQHNSTRQRHLVIAGAEWQPESSEILIIRKFRSAAMSRPAVKEQSFVFGWRARFPNKSSPSLISSSPSWSANALQRVVQGLILGGESEGEEPRLLVPATQDKVTTE